MDPQTEAIEGFWFVARLTAINTAIIAWLGAVLTGVCLLMFRDYIRSAPDDPRYLKALAGIVTALQIFSSILEILGHSQQLSLISRRVIEPGAVISYAVAWIIFATTSSSLCAQLFYGRLIFSICASWGVSSPVWKWAWAAAFSTLWLVVAGSGYGSTAVFVLIPRRSWDPATMSILFNGTPMAFYTAWLASTAGLDVIVSSILVFRLLGETKRGGFASTNSLLTSLAVSTLETFALTASLSIATMVCGILLNHVDRLAGAKLQIVCLYLAVLMGRAYCASFLYTLHRRIRLRGSRKFNSSLPSSHLSPAAAAASSTGGGLPPPPSPIVVGHLHPPRRRQSFSGIGGFPSSPAGFAVMPMPPRSAIVFGKHDDDGEVEGVRVDTEHEKTFDLC